MPGLKILHTADVHLGAKFDGLGSKGDAHRKRLLETLLRVFETAASERVDLFLIAGDLFDSNEVSRSLVSLVASRLKDLCAKGLKVCISPGTHDSYDQDSVYRSEEFSGIDNLHVFKSEKIEPVVFPDINCTVYGNANARPYTEKYPLRRFEPSSQTRWGVGILHASLLTFSGIEDTYIVTPEDITKSGLDYLALGHWHSMREVSSGGSGGVLSYYPGPPELIKMEKGEPGKVLLVELGEERKVEPVEVGRAKFEEITLDAGELEGLSKIYDLLEKERDPDKILRLRIIGTRKGEKLDIDSISEMASKEFFYFRVVDESKPPPRLLEPTSYGERTVQRAYLEVLERKLQQAPEEAKEDIISAKEVGLSLLGEGQAD